MVWVTGNLLLSSLHKVGTAYIVRDFGFLKDKDVLMGFIHPKNSRITKRSHIVILLTTVPDDDVIVDEPYLLHKICNVTMERKELFLFADVHDYHTTICTTSHCLV